MWGFSGMVDRITSTTSEMDSSKFCKSLVPTSRAIGGLNQIKQSEDLAQCLALGAKKYISCYHF